MRDFLEAAPESIFEADAGLVPINNDGAFDDVGSQGRRLIGQNNPGSETIFQQVQVGIRSGQYGSPLNWLRKVYFLARVHLDNRHRFQRPGSRAA
jgi:hypothetical protein